MTNERHTSQLVRSIDEVTPDWLTSVLRGSGAIDEVTAVSAAPSAPFAVGAGLLSLLYKVTPTYEGGPAGPTSLIVKLPTSDPLQRGTADALGLYPREIRFYNDLAVTATFRTAVAHLAVMADDSTDFVIVMEDLSALGENDQRAGVGWDDALVAIDGLARFHAQWHESPLLDDLRTTFIPIDSPMYRAALPQVFAGGWPGAKEHAGDILPPEIVAFGDRWGDLVPWFLSNLDQPSTLLHGDWRLDNLFFDDGEVVVIDFQIMGTGAGSYDLGYFMSQSMPTELRHGREDELFEHYTKSLSAGGVDRSIDDIRRQAKVAVMHCFIYGVSSFQAWDALPDRSRELLRIILGRATRAIIDLDALELLPAVR